ncbi:hypothetical protein ACEWPM_013740 [Roseovarius sp. S4756]|uniref:hypothetical protein n=1 Tax=Roseovarius maritimus TaxID=3342637 RepID=UPI003726F3BC
MQRTTLLTLAARGQKKIRARAKEIGARTVLLGATNETALAALFYDPPDAARIAIYTRSARTHTPTAELSADDVRAADVAVMRALWTDKHAARRMLPEDRNDGVRGTIHFTGADAWVIGLPQSVPFAMGKVAQRCPTESMTRDLHPLSLPRCMVQHRRRYFECGSH